VNLAPDRDQIREFLSATTPIHLGAIPLDGGAVTGRFFGDDYETAAHFAVNMNRDGFNVYFTANEPTPHCGDKPTKSQITRLRTVFVDIDPPKDGEPFDKAAVVATVQRDTPTFVIDSGNGVQAFWRLADPVDATPENVAACETSNRALVDRYGGDPAATNVDRLMRLPGTVNWPNGRKRERGSVPCMARVLSPDLGQARPTLAQLQAHYAPPRPVKPLASADTARPDPNAHADLRSALAAIPADCSYADWVRIGNALKSLGDAGRNLFREWSYSSPNAKPGDPDAKWQQLSADRTGYRVVFAEAQRQGWTNPGYALPQVQPGELPLDPAAFTANGARWVEGVGVVPAVPVEKRYKPLSGADLRALPPLQWIIKGVLPARGLVVMYGPSASGKSFLAIDMGRAIGEGASWFGYRTKPANVVYLALEGEAGIRNRILAWEQKNDRELPDGFRVILDKFKLTNPDDVRALAEVCPKGGVVIVDTLARAGDDDPNDAKLRATNVAAALLLQSLIGGVVVLVAHTGKDETRGISGMKSLFDASDAVIFVTRKDAERSWKADKVKDGSDNTEHAFALNNVFLGVDEDGDPVTSCTIEPLAEARTGPAHRIAAEAAADDVFLGLLSDLAAQGQHVSPAPSSPTYAPKLFEARPGVMHKRAGFAAAMNRLLASGRIRIGKSSGPASKQKDIIELATPGLDPASPPASLVPAYAVPPSGPHAVPPANPCQHYAPAPPIPP